MVLPSHALCYPGGISTFKLRLGNFVRYIVGWFLRWDHCMSLLFFRQSGKEKRGHLPVGPGSVQPVWSEEDPRNDCWVLSKCTNLTISNESWPAHFWTSWYFLDRIMGQWWALHSHFVCCGVPTWLAGGQTKHGLCEHPHCKSLLAVLQHVLKLPTPRLIFFRPSLLPKDGFLLFCFYFWKLEQARAWLFKILGTGGVLYD